MDPQVFKFLSTQRIGCLTTLQSDGAPHAATIHFSYEETPIFYFATSRTTKKCSALLDGTRSKASFVVGFSDTEWITVQIDGEIKLLKDAHEIETAANIHYARHPHAAARFKGNPDTVFLQFIPDWWRYSDFNTKPVTIISSNS